MDSQLLLKKNWSSNYSNDAKTIINSISFENGMGVIVLGSNSLRSQLFPADFDIYQEVRLKKQQEPRALHYLTKEFQRIIRHLKTVPNLYIGDIKAGLVEQWRILQRATYWNGNRVVNYNQQIALHNLEIIKNLIPNLDYNTILKLLTPVPSLDDYSKLRELCKYHIVRWKADDIMNGKVKLLDGSFMTLEEAFKSPIIAKLDVIGFVENSRYMEFAIIYQFFNGYTCLNPDEINITRSLKENIELYMHEQNYFKVLKRLYALAKHKHNEKIVEQLTPILNSDMGILYQIISDINTLILVLSNTKAKDKGKIHFEIDQFINRLSNVYQFKDYLKNEQAILRDIKIATSSSLPILSKIIEPLRDALNNHLQKASKKYIEGHIVL